MDSFSARRVRIVAIGDELLCGHTLNTNAQVLSNALFQQGVIPVSHRVVSDDPNEIRTVLLEELSFGHDVITTGGLGPTLDDLTKKVVSDLFDRRLVQNKELLRELEERYGEGFPTLFNQSIQPEGATLLSNQVGTAPGIFLEDEKLFPHARLFVLPGPPDEMKDVFFRTVLPRYFSGKSFSRYFHILKGKEHEIDPFLRSLSAKWPQLHIGIYPSYGLVGVRFFVEDSSLAAILEEVCVAFESRFRTQLIEEATLEAAVYRILKEKKITIGTAESCTAGGFMARLATIPGSSETCVGGVICYQNSVKEKLLRVPAELIERCGPVSLEVTQKMAEGVRSLLGVDVAVAISGYLGPTGGKAPVGTVCATILFQHKVFSKEFKFCGNRSSILEKTIQLLLACLVEQLAD